MGWLQNHDPLSLLLLICILALACSFIFSWGLKHYEVAITLMLVSPWVHWLFAGNIPRDAAEVLPPGPASYMRTGLVIFTGLIGLVRFIRRRPVDNSKVPFFMVLFFILPIYALASTLYSIDKTYTLVRSVEFLAFYCFLLGLYHWIQNKVLLTRALDIYHAVIVCSIMLNMSTFLLFPERAWWWQAPDRFQGFMTHPNTLGAFCMVSYPILMWKYNRVPLMGKGLTALLFCMTLSMHILSGSRASLVTAIAGFVIWQVMLNRKIMTLAVTITIVLSCAFILQAQFPSFERSENKSITDLTGRTEFWIGCIELLREKPLLGYGYEVQGKIWDDPRFYSRLSTLWMGSARSSLHNGYLSIAIGLGLCGLLLWLAVVLIPVLGALTSPDSSYKALVVVLLVQGLLINIAESALTGSRGFVALTFWFALIIAARLTALSRQETLPWSPA